MLNRRMPNGTYGGVRGERKTPLLDCPEKIFLEKACNRPSEFFKSAHCAFLKKRFLVSRAGASGADFRPREK